MQNVEDHPLAAIFPLMGAADLDALAADIEANGQQDAVWLFEGRILDGRNRYRACDRVGVEPKFRNYEGSDPLGFVISKNLHRRHLTESQRAMVAANIAGWKKGDNQHTAGGSANLPTLTQSQAAEQVSVSDRSVRDAVKVKATGVPELVKAVESGDVSVSAAAEVAKLPKAEQRKAVKTGTVKEKAAEQRKAKKDQAGGGGEQSGADSHPAPVVHDDPAPAGQPADPAAESLDRVESLCRDMDQIAARMKGLKADRYCYAIHVDSAVAQVEAARKTLWQGRAAHPCPYCETTGEGGCKACNGTTRVKRSTRDSGVEAMGGRK
jgi:ParB-like chromosome segregation protein Spo0J